MAIRKRMSWQRQDRCWMNVSWRKSKDSAAEEVYAAVQYAASFHCLVEKWNECEELKPKPIEKGNLRRPEKRRNETSNRMVAPATSGRSSTSTRKCKENTQAHVLVRRSWENGESDIWEAPIW